MEELPHEPDLGRGEAVDDHEFSVETGVEQLEVGGSGRPDDAESPEALVACRFEADPLKAHSQEDVVNRKQIHLI